VTSLPQALTEADLQWYATGRDSGQAVMEFFTAQIRNRNTRRAYAQAARYFAGWALGYGLRLEQLSSLHVAAYIEMRMHNLSIPSVKMHLAALRMLFDNLVRQGVLVFNPALSVKAPRFSATRGRTPVMTGEEVKKLFGSIGAESRKDVRDRALLSVMIYSFARVGAVVKMKVGDYYESGQQHWLRLHEKNGKRHQVPAHSEAQKALEDWIQAAGIEGQRSEPLFRSLRSGKALDSQDVLRMVKCRARIAGLGEDINCHSFRATGITAYLQNGGSLEKAQQLAAHASPQTTKLYDRTGDALVAEEVERVRF